MKCSKCGAELSEDTKFCSYCGQKVETQEPSKPQESGASASPVSSYTYGQTSPENKNSVKQTDGNMASSIADKIKEKGISFWNKRSLYGKITTVALIAFALLGGVAFLFGKTVAAVIAILQIIITVVAILMHKGVIKVDPKQAKLKYVLLAVAVFLTIPNVMNFSMGNGNGDVNSLTPGIEHDIPAQKDDALDSKIVDEDEAAAPQSASDYKFGNYKDAESELKAAGFSEISCEILYDIVLGWTQEGEVDSISINGNADFEKGDIFKKNAPVVITYHMKKEDDPNKPTESIPESTETPDTTTEEPDTSKPLFYSTNDYETAKEGNTGVFAYRDRGSSYDIYWIIDFDEGYVYYFTDGNGESSCDRLKIESGTLNDKIIITYHDGGDTWSYGLHFKYVNHPETLIMNDQNGFDWEYSTTGLSDALNLRASKTIKDY